MVTGISNMRSAILKTVTSLMNLLRLDGMVFSLKSLMSQGHKQVITRQLRMVGSPSRSLAVMAVMKMLLLEVRVLL